MMGYMLPGFLVLLAVGKTESVHSADGRGGQNVVLLTCRCQMTAEYIPCSETYAFSVWL